MESRHSVNKIPLFNCVLCGGLYEGYGNNPEPLAKFNDEEGNRNRACDNCNNDVIAERMLNIQKNISKKN